MLTAMIYLLFSAFLYIWTVASITYDSLLPMISYTVGLIMLLVVVMDGCIICSDRNIREGLLMLGVFLNLRLSTSYCTWRDPHTLVSKEKQESITTFTMWKSTGFIEVLLVLAIVLFTSFIICYTKIFRNRVLNIFLMMVLPLFMILTKVLGKKTGGSYLTIGGVMIFAVVLAGFPFVAATLMTKEENKYWGSNVNNLSWNMLIFLMYEGLLFIGCAVLNEYGLLLILGVTGSLLFWMRCKSLKTRLLYSLTCMIAALVIAFKVCHVSQRFEVMLDPLHASNKQVAETVLYLFRNLPKAGFFGTIGDLPRDIYRQLDTDHVTTLLINDYSLILAIFTVVLMMIFCKWLFQLEDGMCDYDRYLSLTVAIVFTTVVVMHVASNLGSFITAGVGMPFISRGTSINAMYALYIGIHFGLLRKERFIRCYEEEDTTEVS